MNSTNMRETPVESAPVPADEPRPAEVPSAQVQVDLGGLSHQGNVRPNNEDHYLVVRFDRSLQALLTNLPECRSAGRIAEVGYGMVVADGMGGMAAGEVASRLAITTLVHLVLGTPDWIMRPGEHEFEELLRRMAERYRLVGATLNAASWSDPRLTGMGTTMTVAASLGADLFVGHLGDSRAYLLRGGALHQLTRDHTLAQELAERGIIRREEVATHRMRHILTRALGGTADQNEAEVQKLTLADQDQILLCSDGLTDMVDDAAIAAVLGRAASAGEACTALVDLALKNGGRDNVTVVLARYRIPAPAESQAPAAGP
jgi:PPM family protein phosphatase